jgi:hypothetical protein
MTQVIKRCIGTILLLGVILAGCNMPALRPIELEEVDYEGEFTPVVSSPLPSPQVFTTPGQVTAPPTIAVTTIPTLEFDPVTEEISITEMCVISDIGLRLRSDPSIEKNNENVLIAMPKGTDVTWSGNQIEAGGHTWYELEMSDQTKGWSATNPEWIVEGSCDQFITGGITPLIIDQACVSGYYWEDVNRENHYGVDLNSRTKKLPIHAPYSGAVIASDDCTACTADDNESGRHYYKKARANPDLNYGYGAMIILEFPYSDIAQEELEELRKDGILIEDGESLYLMFAHLDPSESILDSGTDLLSGDVVATIGTSGNSSDKHAHVEAAVNESNLRLRSGQSITTFWVKTIVERPELADAGLRFDPLPLFDMTFKTSCWE